MSAIVLWIMCVVIVVALAAWLAAVALAQRRPWVPRPGIERRRGRVQGASVPDPSAPPHGDSGNPMDL